MKVYLASRYSRNEEMRDHADQLEQLGIHVRARWIKGNHSADHLEGEARFLASQKFAIEDYEDVCSADFLILFSDPPRTTTRGGKNVEFGVALGQNKPIFIVGPRENVFHDLPQVTRFDTWEELYEMLKKQAILAQISAVFNPNLKLFA